MRQVWLLLAGMVGVVPGVAMAIDPPHDKDREEMACHYCHSLHTTTASGARDYSAACLGCHNTSGTLYGFPWSESDEAVPGVTGISHSWSAPATNPSHGAAPKLLLDQAELLVDGKLQCALCHDLHSHGEGLDVASMHTSIPRDEGQANAGQPKTGTVNADTSGSAELKLKATTGAPTAGFRIQIKTVAGGGGTFILSHTYGYDAARWVVWNGSGWVAGTIDGNGRPFTNGTYVDTDIAGVSVSISAGAKVGDYWEFYVAYPFLRLSNKDDFACGRCHAERVMNHVRARGDDRTYRPNGVKKFSHPVGVGLNANLLNMDRAVVLDADGTAGSSTTDGAGGVANASNDLELKGGVVRCTTCHAAHNADSNSLSVDAR